MNEFLAPVRYHLAELRFRRGILINAALGQGNHVVGYVLRKAPEQNWSSGYRRGAWDTASDTRIVTTTDSRHWVT